MAKPRRNAVVHEIQRLRLSLLALDRSLRRFVPLLTAETQNGKAHEQPRRRRRVSAKARVSLRLHGKYIGHLRHLKPRQKAQVRNVKEAKGVRAAIARAKVLARA